METYRGENQGAEGPWYTSLWVLLVVILGIALLVAWVTSQRGPAGLADEPQQVVVVPQGPPDGERRGGPGRAHRQEGGPPSGGMPGDTTDRGKPPPVSDI